ncbi:MAG: hypothetical protein K1X66_02435 [Verrucomicrobiae bacterium]|nr:hypothetical protein [Verrucomicrobiae bacterium]
MKQIFKLKFLFLSIVLTLTNHCFAQITPIENGKLLSDLDANSYSISSLSGLSFQEYIGKVNASGLLTLPSRAAFFVNTTNLLVTVTNGVAGKLYVIRANAAFTISNNPPYILITDGSTNNLDLSVNDVVLGYATSSTNLTIIR